MPLKVALIGLQGHWHSVLEELPGLAGVELVGVADEEATAARVVSFPGATVDTQAFTDWRALLDRTQPDIVIEAGIDSARAEVVVECAARGLHFLCEKPLAKTTEELVRVREAVAQSGVTGSMMISMRCDPHYLAMRAAVQQGLIGDVTQGGGQKSYRLGERPGWQQNRATFSGIIPFVGIHIVDLFRWVSGREYAEVMAYGGNIAHPEVGELEDSACVLARLDNGAPAAFRLDYCRPAAAPTHGDDRLRVAGSRGVIESSDGKVTLITREEGPRELSLPEPVAFFADFVAAVRGGRAPFIPFEECARSTEVVLRAREAMETGRPQRV